MNTFTIYWRFGKREVMHGNGIFDALKRHGYVEDSLYAVVLYAKGICNDYMFINDQWKYIGK